MHDLPECPLLDGSLAYTEKLKLMIDEQIANKPIVEIFFNNLQDFHNCVRFISRETSEGCTESAVLLRATPASSHFSHIFGLIQWLPMKGSQILWDNFIRKGEELSNEKGENQGTYAKVSI